MTEPGLESEPIRSFAGCAISTDSFEAWLDRLIKRIDSGQRARLVGAHNLFSLHLFHRDADARRFFSSCEEAYVDGVGVLWLLRLAGVRTRSIARFTFMDCLPELLDRAEQRGLRVFYLGGAPRVAERGQAWLAESWPALACRVHHGYFESSDPVVDAIREFRPDLLLVGMGMPRQERWILDHRQSLDAGIILQAGGTLDYYTGAQARPPRSLSRLGLAWLYRLMHDPRRLWRRYLLTPFSLLGPTLHLRRRLRRGGSEQDEGKPEQR